MPNKLSTEEIVELESIFSILDVGDKELKQMGSAVKELNAQIAALRATRDAIISDREKLITKCKESMIDLERLLRRNKQTLEGLYDPNEESETNIQEHSE